MIFVNAGVDEVYLRTSLEAAVSKISNLREISGEVRIFLTPQREGGFRLEILGFNQDNKSLRQLEQRLLWELSRDARFVETLAANTELQGNRVVGAEFLVSFPLNTDAHTVRVRSLEFPIRYLPEERSSQSSALAPELQQILTQLDQAKLTEIEILNTVLETNSNWRHTTLEHASRNYQRLEHSRIAFATKDRRIIVGTLMSIDRRERGTRYFENESSHARHPRVPLGKEIMEPYSVMRVRYLDGTMEEFEESQMASSHIFVNPEMPRSVNILSLANGSGGWSELETPNTSSYNSYFLNHQEVLLSLDHPNGFGGVTNIRGRVAGFYNNFGKPILVESLLDEQVLEDEIATIEIEVGSDVVSRFTDCERALMGLETATALSVKPKRIQVKRNSIRRLLYKGIGFTTRERFQSENGALREVSLEDVIKSPALYQGKPMAVLVGARARRLSNRSFGSNGNFRSVTGSFEGIQTASVTSRRNGNSSDEGSSTVTVDTVSIRTPSGEVVRVESSTVASVRVAPEALRGRLRF